MSKPHHINIKICPELRQKLKVLAVNKKMTLRSLVLQIFEETVKGQEKAQNQGGR